MIGGYFSSMVSDDAFVDPVLRRAFRQRREPAGRCRLQLRLRRRTTPSGLPQPDGCPPGLHAPHLSNCVTPGRPYAVVVVDSLGAGEIKLPKGADPQCDYASI